MLAVREHQTYVFGIPIIYNCFCRKMSLEFGTLVVKQVIAKGATTHEFASTSCLEPLCGSFAGLKLWHVSSFAQYIRLRP